MKLLMVLALVLFCTAAFSQNNRNFFQDLTPTPPLYHYKPDQKRITTPFNSGMPEFQNIFTQKGPNGGIVFLPQDRMPCLVPPAATNALIPNFWHMPAFPITGRIPNPAEPFNLERRPQVNNLPIIELPYHTK